MITMALSRNLWLRAGTATSPERGRLPLLPSGPGGIHGLSPCGTHPSTLQEKTVTTEITREREFNPPMGICGYKGPQALRLAQHRKGRDSNPRRSCPLSRSPGVCLRPTQPPFQLLL